MRRPALLTLLALAAVAAVATPGCNSTPIVAQYDALQGGHTGYMARIALSQLWASRPAAVHGTAPCDTAA